MSEKHVTIKIDPHQSFRDIVCNTPGIAVQDLISWGRDCDVEECIRKMDEFFRQQEDGPNALHPSAG